MNAKQPANRKPRKKEPRLHWQKKIRSQALKNPKPPVGAPDNEQGIKNSHPSPQSQSWQQDPGAKVQKPQNETLLKKRSFHWTWAGFAFGLERSCFCNAVAKIEKLFKSETYVFINLLQPRHNPDNKMLVARICAFPNHGFLFSLSGSLQRLYKTKPPQASSFETL